ncbi:hypothetical protein H6G27_23175 [Nostoc linckia FACHB-104]|nr:hypothetical protein [Nostoc linckia FACHB-104]
MTTIHELDPSDYRQLSAEEIKQDILRKLDKIDLKSITHLSGNPNFHEDTEHMNSWFIWTVTIWRR